MQDSSVSKKKQECDKQHADQLAGNGQTSTDGVPKIRAREIVSHVEIQELLGDLAT